MAELLSDSFIERFRIAAIDHEKAVKSGNHKLSELAYGEMKNAVDSLRLQLEWLDCLAGLLEDEEQSVQTWAAAVLLGESDVRGLIVFKRQASVGGFYQFGATEVLRQWESGEFASPFPH